MRLIVPAVLVALSSSAFAEVYVQDSDQPSQASFFSDAVAGQFFSQRMADNFTLASDTEVTQIRWWGGSQNFQFADLTNMSSYTVRIFADDLSTEVFSTTVDTELSSLSVSATGATLFGGGMEFEYTLDLGSALSLSGGSEYWISIGSTLVNGGADAWVWSGSSMGDLVNATDFFNGSGFTVFDPTFNDLAFAIVPSPGSASVLVGAGLVLVRRRR